MADLLATGTAWLAAQLEASVASAATYVRGGSSVQLSVTRGKTAFEVQDSHGYLTRIEAEDFFITASKLILDGEVTLPKRGDLIQQTIGGCELTFEVGAPGASENHYRFSDAYRNKIRVHTKQVAAS